MDGIAKVFNFLVETGTNGIVWEFLTKNAILLGAIAYVTPWTWDNRLLDYFKSKIGKEDKPK